MSTYPEQPTTPNAVATAFSGHPDNSQFIHDHPNDSTTDAPRTPKGVHFLPPGAAPPLTRTPVNMENSNVNDVSHSPPGTPSQRLLGDDESQYATEKPPVKKRAWVPVDVQPEEKEIWKPFPLRPMFWVPFVLFLLLGAVGLEVALSLTKKNNGWPTKNGIGEEAGILHYVYTLPPVFIAAGVAAMWAWTDVEIKKMQPYVDLVHGDSPPERSLLLDYTRTSNFYVWTQAAGNKHYLVALATLMVLLTISFQPLSAALLVVRDTWWHEPDMSVQSLRSLGFNNSFEFQQLTPFLTAAGFASASILYNLTDPSFIHNEYSIAPFELPTDVDIVKNGTVYANTTAVKSQAGCVYVEPSLSKDPNGFGWNNTLEHAGCSMLFNVDKRSTTLFGTGVPNCTNPVPDQFSPVVLWFFTYQPVPRGSSAMCFPSISFWEVNVGISLANSSVISVQELRPFSSDSPRSSLSDTVLGPPINGQAYNGIEFNLTDADPFVLARRDATALQLPAAVFQLAEQSERGLFDSFLDDTLANYANEVYSIYLPLVAKEAYFLPDTQPMGIEISTVRKRLWLSDTAVHLLAVGMFILAIFGTIVQLFHRADRRDLRLKHEPGTIASAVSIGGQTGIGELLAGRQRAKDIHDVLQDKKFRINPRTMRIVMEGEDEYEQAASPIERRKSIFAALQNQRSSRRFSQNPDMLHPSSAENA